MFKSRGSEGQRDCGFCGQRFRWYSVRRFLRTFCQTNSIPSHHNRHHSVCCESRQQRKTLLMRRSQRRLRRRRLERRCSSIHPLMHASSMQALLLMIAFVSDSCAVVGLVLRVLVRCWCNCFSHWVTTDLIRADFMRSEK